MSAKMQSLVAPEALVVEVGTPPLPRPPGERPPRVVEVTAADVLERAADLLGEFGWCQHGRVGSKETGVMCALGAFIEAANDFGISWLEVDRGAGVAWDAVVPAAFKAGGFGNFNDEPGRTKAEVVAKLRQAASHARGEVQELGGSAAARSAGGQ